MNVNTGEIKMPEEMRQLVREATGEARKPPKAWTRFGTGDAVSLHNLAGRRIGWFRVQLVTKKRVSLRPISEQEAEEDAKAEGLA